MALIAIPNVSEGRSGDAVDGLERRLTSNGCRVLDVHADAVHNRSVFTTTGSPGAVIDGLTALAGLASRMIDLRLQTGVHPRVGALDVCPIVPHGEPMDNAIAAAHAVGAAIAQRNGLPVYFYERAADPPRPLPEIRRGGLAGLIQRALSGFAPDLGPREIDPARGVVCVGARDVLIAFNVCLRTSVDEARAVAAVARGMAGVRALGLKMPAGEAQVSMNLTRPDLVGIDAAFGAVAAEAERRGVEVVTAEIVGLVPARYLPNPDAPAARHLSGPGRSLESVLAG